MEAIKHMTRGLDPTKWTVRVHGEVLADLESKIQPPHTALVIIDMQNDFCEVGGLMADEGVDLQPVQEMAKQVMTVLDAARRVGVLVVFVRNVYSTESNWYLSDPWLEVASRRYSGESYTQRDACPPDSWKADFYGDVRPLPSDPVVTKHRYSAFYSTDLDLILRNHGIRTVVMVGVATNVCVETSVREAFVRDYYVVVPHDATAAYSPDAYEASLRNVAMHFGQVVAAEDILTAWSALDPAKDPADVSSRPGPARCGSVVVN
jgi:ureidoacrylate peracid hydrolase